MTPCVPQPSVPSCAPWSGAWLSLAVVAGVGVLLLLGGALTAPATTAAGGAWTEAPNHLWTLAMCAQGLWQEGPFQFATDAVNFPEGLHGQVMDPINLLWYLPGFWLAGGGVRGATLGYNLVVGGNLLLAVWGGYRVGRAVSGSAQGGALTATALVFSASFLSLTTFGFSEHMPIGWLAWHLEALYRALRGERRQVAVAGLTLMAVVWAGAYLALAVAIEVSLLTLTFLWRHRTRRTLLAACVVASLGLAAVVPTWLSIQRHQGQALASVDTGNDRSAAGLTARGRDLRDLIPHLGPAASRSTASLEGGDDEPASGKGSGSRRFRNPAWPGALLCLLASVALGVRPRQAVVWWGLALLFFLLHLGPVLVSDGQPVTLGGRSLLLPAWYLARWLPPLGLISDWGKLGVVMTLNLSLAAGTLLSPRATGVQRAGPILALMGLLGLETLLVAQPPWPARTFSTETPAGLLHALALLPPGPLLQLPFDNQPRRNFPTPAYSYSLWQLGHGRPIAENDEGADAALLANPLLRALEVADGDSLGVPQAWRPVAPSGPVDHRAAWRALREAGFVAVVLHRRRVGQSGRWEAALSEDLGPPQVRTSALWGWSLEP